MQFAELHKPDTRGQIIADQINRNGYAVIHDFVNPADLATAQDFIRAAVKANGGEYTGFKGTDQLQDIFLGHLPEDPGFVSLCRSIYESGTGTPAPDEGFYQILRCLSGAGAKNHSMRFHFDSYVLTALIPVIVPDHGNPGRLIIHPNTRDIRKTYMRNLVDKTLSDNALSQRLLGLAYRLGTRRMLRLALQPGSIYFFWGYRSLHTNEPCDADAIRATALFHYVDPHSDSQMKQKLRRG
ncbi:hypothetical protein [Frigidibacter sp. MR17.24]|uniref:hypothetical protein n=1 Tax=Frigidibacter sp. MR17.24 TaxID=3127345 RepID=UPI003012A018